MAKKKTVLDLDGISGALDTRPGFADVSDDTRVALNMFYGGRALDREVDSFSAKEDPVKYDWRRKTAIENYDNYPEEISSSYLEAVKKAGKIERSFTADKKETPSNDFLDTEYRKWFDRDFAAISLILPETYVQVSLPEIDDPDGTRLISKADEQELGMVPEMHVVYPQFVQNFQQDRFGNIECITLKTGNSTFEVYDSVSVHTVELAVNADKVRTVKVNESKPHGFNVCPFVRVIWRENKTYEGSPKPGQAMMHGIVRRSRGALTLMSMFLESMHFHLYPKLAMGQETLKNVLEMGMGSDKITPVGDGGAGVPEPFPAYIQTDTKPIEVLERINYERIPAIMYHLARLRDRYAQKAQSGISKAFDMVPEVSVLTEVADFWRGADVRIMAVVADGFKLSDAAIVAEYPRSFQVKSVAEILQEVAELMRVLNESEMPESLTFNRIVVKKLYRQLYPDMPDADLKIINAEIDEWVKPLEPPVPGAALNLPKGMLEQEQMES